MDNTAIRLADFISDMTDPRIPRWRREQIAIEARVVARAYLKKLEGK